MRDKHALIITRNFPPLTGGMERLMWNLFKGLKPGYGCSLIGPTGCKKYVSAGDNAFEAPVSSIYVFLIVAFIKSIFCAAVKKYSICIAGSGVTAPVAFAVKKIFHIPMVVLIHGLDLIVDNKIYQKFFIPAILHADIVIVNSKYTSSLVMAKGYPKDKIKILFPGVNIPKLPLKKSFRKRYGVENNKILLSVGRLVPRKGIAEFLEHSFPEILKRFPQSKYIIIGEEPRNSLKKSRNLVKKIESIVYKKGLKNNVILLGHVDDKTLANAYYEADLHILPVRDIPGDIEGFGMVIIEAASYGLPTVSFSVGGVPDALCHRYSGFLVEHGNYESFSKIIIDYFAGKTSGVNKENCIDHAKSYSWVRYGIRLRELCDQISI